MTPEPPDAAWSFGGGGFAKLYGDRLAQSSLLDRNVATRWVFVFLLSQADAQGRYRCASVAGLARAAAITIEQATLAISELEAPDADSTSKDEDGRRIVRIPGGWRLVTYAKYREFKTPRQLAEATKKRRQREAAKSRRHKRKAPELGTCPPRPRDVPGTALQRTDVRRQSSDDRDTNDERPSDSLVAELEQVCQQIASRLGCSTAAAMQRVSAMPASNGFPPNAGFTDARRVSAPWVRKALSRARDEQSYEPPL